MPNYQDDARNFVIFVLKNAEKFDWTKQGLGMLRLYINDPLDSRLTIWHHNLRIDNVSSIHDHSWDFESTVFAGHIDNKQYNYCLPAAPRAIPIYRGFIKPGIGGHGPKSQEVFNIRLINSECIPAGSSYKQTAVEIHETDYEDGTVTLCRRFNRGEDVALSFWRRDSEWVSAHPVPATKEEVVHYASIALTLF